MTIYLIVVTNVTDTSPFLSDLSEDISTEVVKSFNNLLDAEKFLGNLTDNTIDQLKERCEEDDELDDVEFECSGDGVNIVYSENLNEWYKMEIKQFEV